MSVILHQGQLCLHLVKSYLEDGQLVMEAKRCQIMIINHMTQCAGVVFLDYGIEMTAVSLESIWPIEDKQISCLPFQAIRLNLACNRYGIMKNIF